MVLATTVRANRPAGVSDSVLADVRRMIAEARNNPANPDYEFAYKASTPRGEKMTVDELERAAALAGARSVSDYLADDDFELERAAALAALAGSSTEWLELAGCQSTAGPVRWAKPLSVADSLAAEEQELEEEVPSPVGCAYDRKVQPG